MELRHELADEALNFLYRRLKERDREQKRHRVYKLVRNLPLVSVRMDGTKNHQRPHLHCSIDKKHHVASIAIDNGEVLAGKLSSTQLSEVRGWIQRHKLALLRLWNEMQGGRPIEALICELQAEENVDFRRPRKRRKKSRRKRIGRKPERKLN